MSQTSWHGRWKWVILECPLNKSYKPNLTDTKYNSSDGGLEDVALALSARRWRSWPWPREKILQSCDSWNQVLGHAYSRGLNSKSEEQQFQSQPRVSWLLTPTWAASCVSHRRLYTASNNSHVSLTRIKISQSIQLRTMVWHGIDNWTVQNSQKAASSHHRLETSTRDHMLTISISSRLDSDLLRRHGTPGRKHSLWG